MFQKWTLYLVCFSMVTFSCDMESTTTPLVPDSGVSAATAHPTTLPTAGAPAASVVASATAVPAGTTAPTITPTASVVTANTAPVPPPEPDKVEEIKITDPEGVEFVRQSKWRIQEPNWDGLERMPHAQNAPVLDIVVLHSAVLTTADNEVDVLRNIMAAHMNPSTGRGWSDISVHYLVGPSGKVYQGRLIWYRADGSVGIGMGRFHDNWNKCAIMVMGDFNNPAQEFTSAAQQTLTTLIDDRRENFERIYEDELKIREAETRALMGSVPGHVFGLDQVRVRKHPSLPASIQSFLDTGGDANSAGDGGTTP